MAAKNGDTVRVHYKGTLDDGSEFDSSHGRDPIEFTLGEGQMIPGFEEAVMGMEVGETKSSRIPAAQAYGEHHDEMVIELSRDDMPPGMELTLGQEVELQTDEGYSVPATVMDIGDESITLDANHPLAGQDLLFELRLEEIV